MKNTINKPKISVVMPVYNAARFLRACLDSILSQTFTNFEIIAVNDGSKDSSLYILQEYAKSDSRVKVYDNGENKGISKTINRAISLASADYIARMDADDIMVRNRLQIEYDFLSQNPEYILVGGQVRLVDITGQHLNIKTFPLDHKEISNMLYTAMPVQHGTLLINKTKVPADFVWYDDGMNTAEEVELLFKLLKYGKFKNLDEIMLDYRQHNESITHSIPKEVFRLTLIARKKAVELHGYKPTFTARFISNLQKIIVAILPENKVMPVYFIVRKTLFALNKFVNRNQESTSEHESRLLQKFELQRAILASN